jgi:hypothetical protein
MPNETITVKRRAWHDRQKSCRRAGRHPQPPRRRGSLAAAAAAAAPPLTTRPPAARGASLAADCSWHRLLEWKTPRGRRAPAAATTYKCNLKLPHIWVAARVPPRSCRHVAKLAVKVRGPSAAGRPRRATRRSSWCTPWPKRDSGVYCAVRECCIVSLLFRAAQLRTGRLEFIAVCCAPALRDARRLTFGRPADARARWSAAKHTRDRRAATRQPPIQVPRALEIQ